MHPLFLVTLLLVADPQASGAAAPAAAAQPADDLSAEVARAVAAYNGRDLSYYQTVLDPKSVYIAEDGGVISGRDRVLRTFGRIFTADPPRHLEISDVTTDRRGDTGWAVFRWTLTAGSDIRQGVTSVLYIRGDGVWRPMLIQNTLRGHGSPHAGPPSGPPSSPSPAPR